MTEAPVQKPQRPTIVAAIITSSEGVLVGKRHDGKPPWTFIAGENEPGESPADTIIREVKEETGLEGVRRRRGRMIGRSSTTPKTRPPAGSVSEHGSTIRRSAGSFPMTRSWRRPALRS